MKILPVGKQLGRLGVAAKRPPNSLLSGDKLRRDYGVAMPAWEVAARLCLADLLECNG